MQSTCILVDYEIKLRMIAEIHIIFLLFGGLVISWGNYHKQRNVIVFLIHCYCDFNCNYCLSAIFFP